MAPIDGQLAFTEEQRATSRFLSPDLSLHGKLRRRISRGMHRRPAMVQLDKPLLSITFDDVLESAATTGARLLEGHGARGTFFAAASYLGHEGKLGRFATREQLQQLADQGHELACHTWAHLNCGVASPEAIAEDCRRNADAFARWDAPPLKSFAFPFGDVSPTAKRALGPRFQVLRALHHGLVETGTDLNQAPAVGLEGSEGESAAMHWLQKAVARRAWLILYTHDVAEECSPYGCTPAALDRVMTVAQNLGCDVVTVAEASARLKSVGPR